jgi:hypothetical protein
VRSRERSLLDSRFRGNDKMDGRLGGRPWWGREWEFVLPIHQRKKLFF